MIGCPGNWWMAAGEGTVTETDAAAAAGRGGSSIKAVQEGSRGGEACWENDGSGAMTEVSSEVGLSDTGSGKGLLVVYGV